MSLAFNKSSTCLTVFLNGELFTVPVDAPNFRAVITAIKSGDEDSVYTAINVEESVKEAFTSVLGQSCQVTVTAEGVFVGDSIMHNALSSKIMEFMSAGLSFAPLVKFLENFMENPLVKLASNPEVLAMMGKSPDQAHEIVNEFTDDFYSFLNNKDLPVTDAGTFLAYKSVGSDYYSVTSGKTVLTKGHVNDRGQVYNGIGEEIECDRGQVDPSRRNECSYGLHVGSLEYVQNFSGEKKIIVEVNPKDVVAIPPDCNRQKMRVCAYKVLQDCKQALTKPAYVTSTYDHSEDDLYDDDGFEFYEDSYTDEVDEVTVDSIYIGDEIRFDYTHDNETKTRYLDVTEYGFVNSQLDRLIGVLMAPEENEGEYRSFKVNKMENIVYI